MAVHRPEPPAAGDEKSTLVGFLDYQRATLRWKCDGLTPGQLIRPASPPSTLRLLGLVRHMTEVESGWFSHHLGGAERNNLYSSEADPDADLNVAEADEASVALAWVHFDEAVHASRVITEGNELDMLAAKLTRDGTRHSLRWVLAHMIEEYARHNGHADLLREAIDGATGE